MITNQPKEITLIFHSDKSEDRKARAFIETISGFTIKTLDLKRDRLTETLLAEIANKMNLGMQKLFDATYKDRFQTKTFTDIYSASESDLLKILINEPILINTPIAIIGKRAYAYSSAFDFISKINGDKSQVMEGPLAVKKIVF